MLHPLVVLLLKWPRQAKKVLCTRIVAAEMAKRHVIQENKK